MRPFALLQCLAKALVRHAGNAVGFGWAGDVAVKVGEDVWKEWNRQSSEDERRAEVEALVQMAEKEFREQVARIVREVAAGQPEEVRQKMSRYLEEVSDRLRKSLRRPADRAGLSVPRDLPLRNSEQLLALLSFGDRQSGSKDEPLPAKVTLTVTKGPLEGQQVVFDERTTCIIGREEDCSLRLPEPDGRRTISRHHCLLDINPPDICVRDLGSRNGTLVDDQFIGKRPEGMSAEDGRRLNLPERNLKDGNVLKLCEWGAAAFRVNVFVPTVCVTCGTPIADERKAASERTPGVYQCDACRQKATAATLPQPLRRCAECGRDVAGEVGAQRQGDFICAACRKKPKQLLQARAAAGDVPAIQGYTLGDKLGQGGMGAVWLARHERTGEQAAIKVMLPQVAADERAVKRFLCEMTNNRILNHRHVVRLRDAGYSHGTFFLVLEFCDGGSVGGLMEQRGGTLPVDEAVEITVQALEGLHYAHNVFGPGKGLVHRDLKPANLFLSGAGSARLAKVGDYGLAKAFDEAGLSGSTRTGETAGTPEFMSRRQVIEFKYAGPDVDVWAMAASLYNMLTGTVPRDFPPDQDRWLVVLETDPVPIRKRKASIPKKLAEAIDRALVEGPEIHFKTAAELKEALEAAL
jgi:serine/threonine-protein kinase